MNRKKLLIGISLIALSTSLGGSIAYAKAHAEKPPLPEHTLTQDPAIQSILVPSTNQSVAEY